MSNYVMTVTGLVSIEQLGKILPHEHLLVDFSGLDVPGYPRYDPEEAYTVIYPYLMNAKQIGINTLIEYTPAYLGRSVKLLQTLSQNVGIHIVTNTGYYGAANDKFLPRCPHNLAVNVLTETWAKEFHEGIEHSGIKPGFIKTGVDPGKLSEIDKNLIRAAARTSLITGLPVASHTVDKTSLLESLQVFEEEGCPLDRFIWVHAHTVQESEFHIQIAKRGVWIEFDGLSDQSLEDHFTFVTNMRNAGLLSKTLVSHDAGWYNVGEPKGGKFKPFNTLIEKFIPFLIEKGWTEAQIQTLVEINPTQAFALRKESI